MNEPVKEELKKKVREEHRKRLGLAENSASERVEIVPGESFHTSEDFWHGARRIGPMRTILRGVLKVGSVMLAFLLGFAAVFLYFAKG